MCFPQSSRTRSCSQRVIRFSWAWVRQLYPLPVCERVSPYSPLLMTLIQGRGVRGVAMMYSVPSGENDPNLVLKRFNGEYPSFAKWRSVGLFRLVILRKRNDHCHSEHL